MTEWGKALRPSVHDLIKQTNALDAKIDDIETLPIVSVDYDTENVEISATINKTYEELRTYAQGCIVHDAYFNDVTLGTVTVDDDFVQLVYGFSGIVSEAVTYNTITIAVNADGTNEVVIGTDSFSGGNSFKFKYVTHPGGATALVTFADLKAAIDSGKYIFAENQSGTTKNALMVINTYDDNNINMYLWNGIASNDGLINITHFSFSSNENLNIDFVRTSGAGNGLTFNSNSGYINLATASTTQLGGVKIGNGLSIDGNGVLSASGGSGNNVFVIESTSYWDSDEETDVIEITTTPNELHQAILDNKIIYIHYPFFSVNGNKYDRYIPVQTRDQYTFRFYTYEYNGDIQESSSSDKIYISKKESNYLNGASNIEISTKWSFTVNAVS